MIQVQTELLVADNTGAPVLSATNNSVCTCII